MRERKMKRILSVFMIIALLLGMTGVVFATGAKEEGGILLNSGEKFLIGPYDAAEQNLGSFGGKVITPSDATLIGSFAKGQKLYAFTAAESGNFIANDEAYAEMFLAKKIENKTPSMQDYYDYWDNRGANLYNATLDGADGYLKGFNNRNNTVNHRCSHFVSVKEGDTITFGPANPNQSFHAVGLKADGSVADGEISKGDMMSVSSQKLQHDLVFYTYKVPAGMAYISVINYTPVQSFFVALKNAPALTPDSYYEFLGVKDDPLYGKSVLFVGDSISQGENDAVQNGIRLAWAGRIGLSKGMTYKNASVGGVSLSTERGARVLDQLNQNAGNTYDYVMIHGGVNDAWGTAPSYVPVPVGEVTEGFTGNYNKDTYAGGLELTFEAARRNFPNAKLIYIMNFYAPECPRGTVSDMSAYFAEGAKICEKWDVFVCDLYSTITLDDRYYLDDRMIHPNQYGYDILYPAIAASMNAYTLAEPLMEKIDKLDLMNISLIKTYADAKKDFDALPEGVEEYIENRSMLEVAAKRLENAKQGDLNLDDEVDLADLVRLLRYESGKIPADALHLAKGDLTGEGLVDTADAVALAQKFLN